MANMIRKTYDKLTSYPFGKPLFDRFVRYTIPYTGTIKPQVQEVKPGFARVKMADRKIVRNHLHSIHAIAMMNLAEFTTGLAVHYDLPDDARAILTHLSIEYLKKGRGPLVAECRCEPPRSSERKEYEVEAQIYDESNNVVAKARAKWLISGPKKQAR